MRPNRWTIIALLTSLAAGCQARGRSDCDRASADRDCDGAVVQVDCDDADPRRAPGIDEVVGDGVDQDCDGSDHPTTSLREAASARYASELGGSNLGWRVACGPDRGDDGVGDLAAIASQFGDHPWRHSFAAALPGPVPGEHSVEEVLDLRVEPAELSPFTVMLGLVGHEHGGGLILENRAHDEEMQYRASFVTQSGPIDENTPTLALPMDVWQALGTEVRPFPYAGPADLTGDGDFDYALGPMVLESIPEGLVDLSAVGRLALEPTGQRSDWSGTENAVGDLDHDGQDDLLFSGVVPPVWVVFGPIGEVPAERDGPDVAQFWPEDVDLPTAQNFAAEIGDVSGDGIDDLVIANMWYGADASSASVTGIGAVYVWFGPLSAGRHTTATADARFVGELPGAWTGRGLALADFDGDGTRSLVVGAPASRLAVPGLVYVFDEPLKAGELTAADAVAIYRGEEPNATTGFSVVACDTDRDGRDELVVGAPRVDTSDSGRDAGVFYWLAEGP